MEFKNEEEYWKKETKEAWKFLKENKKFQNWLKEKIFEDALDCYPSWYEIDMGDYIKLAVQKWKKFISPNDPESH